MPFATKTLLAVLSGLMLTASFPPLELHWLAWISLLPLLICLKDHSARGAFRLGLTAGLPLYSTLLVPAGRREKYRTCLSIAIRAGVTALLMSTAMCVVSFATGAFLPSITFSGRTLPYLPMDPDMVLAPLLMLPLLLACQVVVPKRATIPQTALLIIGLMMGSAASGSTPNASAFSLGAITAAIMAFALAGLSSAT